MRRVAPSLNATLAAVLAACVAGCASSGSGDEAPGRPQSERLTFANAWAAAVLDMGQMPVYPPSEDVYVGDVYAFASPPSYGTAGTAEGLLTAATPRWSSLPVLPLLEQEYSERPEWDGGAGSDPDSQSLYRAGRAPARHRIVGLRSMLKVTLQVPDLEPFIPIEIAALIDGPATPEHLGISVQAGDAETYSLSLDAMVGLLLDPVDTPVGPRYALKPEHMGNLSVMADPVTGWTYLVVVTEVLYMRSIEASVRRREQEIAPNQATGRARNDDEAAEAPPSPNSEDDLGPGLAAIQRAQAMNEALGAEGRMDSVGGAIEIVMATEDSITLRRSWPYPMAVGIRGVTLVINTANGRVLQMGPLGVEAPKVPEPPAPQPEDAPVVDGPDADVENPSPDVEEPDAEPATQPDGEGA